MQLWRNHEKVHQCQPYPSHLVLLRQGNSVVLLHDSKGDWFQRAAGVGQGCLLSPTLFNIFPERITTDALEDYEGTVSI